MDQITRSNVATLSPRWLFQYGIIDGVSNQTTPVVVDGVMYVTDPRGSVYALDAADGHLLWSYDVTDLIGGGRREGYVFRNRGVAYANGVVYSAAGSFLFALDARTGKPVSTFGKNGQASVIMDVIRKRFPDVQQISLGYWFTTYRRYATASSTSAVRGKKAHSPAVHVLAVNANTGAVLWHFNTIPQDRTTGAGCGSDWVGGERNGGASGRHRRSIPSSA
jgi:quinoprotein glucose dehydrogenase